MRLFKARLSRRKPQEAEIYVPAATEEAARALALVEAPDVGDNLWGDSRLAPEDYEVESIVETPS